jgi:hypothetical protein
VLSLLRLFYKRSIQLKQNIHFGFISAGKTQLVLNYLKISPQVVLLSVAIADARLDG